MSDSSTFKINTQSIAHETIDGEVVMVNLSNGSYYSMDKVGAVVWNFIDQGMTSNQIIERINEQYSGESSEIEHSVNELLAELHKEELILPGEVAINKNGHNNGALELEKTGFEKPVLHKFSDMQDLLMLDPIHDVDEMGWPDPQKAAENKKQ